MTSAAFALYVPAKGPLATTTVHGFGTACGRAADNAAMPVTITVERNTCFIRPSSSSQPGHHRCGRNELGSLSMALPAADRNAGQRHTPARPRRLHSGVSCDTLRVQ